MPGSPSLPAAVRCRERPSRIRTLAAPADATAPHLLFSYLLRYSVRRRRRPLDAPEKDPSSGPEDLSRGNRGSRLSDRHDDDIRLFIPGPAGVTPQVQNALAGPVMPHYGRDFVARYRHCKELLQRVYRTRNDIYLIVGPGTAALDAAMTSALPDGARVLVPSSGWFGARLAEMCRSHRAEVELLEFPLGEPVDADRVVERLHREPGVDAVAWVHHETSTGVLNPVEPIGRAAREVGAVTILDAVSSMGGTELPVDEWCVDLCVSVSNKCLAAIPGLAAVSVSPQAWEAIDANDATRGWYLDLRTWRRYDEEWGAWHPYPTTVPSNLLDAFIASLEELEREGLDERLRRTARAAESVRSGLRGLGFEMFVEDAWASPVTTAVRAHPDLPPADLQRFLRQRHGIYISGGLDELHGVLFRIGHMGTAIVEAEIERLMEAVEEALRETGAPVTEGAAREEIQA